MSWRLVLTTPYSANSSAATAMMRSRLSASIPLRASYSLTHRVTNLSEHPRLAGAITRPHNDHVNAITHCGLEVLPQGIEIGCAVHLHPVGRGQVIHVDTQRHPE